MGDKSDKDGQAKQAEAVDAFAAATAIGFAVASRTMEMWFGAMSGFARASREIVAPHLEARTRSFEKNASKAPVANVESPELKIVKPAEKPSEVASATRLNTSKRAKKEGEARPAASATQAPRSIDRPEVADDLKQIAGVGPKLEQVLNGLGVWTFAQVAAWQPDEIAWVDNLLGLNGRIENDKWLEQAASLGQAGMQKRDVAAG